MRAVPSRSETRDNGHLGTHLVAEERSYPTIPSAAAIAALIPFSAWR